MYLNKKQVTDRKACGPKHKITFRILQKLELSTAFHTWDYLLTLLYHPSVLIKYSQTVCNFSWIPNTGYEYWINFKCHMLKLYIFQKRLHCRGSVQTYPWKWRKEKQTCTHSTFWDFSLFSYLSTQTSNHHMSEKFSCKHGTPGAEKVGDDSQSKTYIEMTMKKEKKSRRI